MNEQHKRVFTEVSDSFHALMGAKEGKLDTPVSFETSFSGTHAEALGSARHTAEVIEESGYEVEIDHLGESEPLPSQDERHRFKMTVTEE